MIWLKIFLWASIAGKDITEGSLTGTSAISLLVMQQMQMYLSQDQNIMNY